MNSNRTLAQWLSDFLPEHVILTGPGGKERGVELGSVSGDAGFRSYYRTNTQPALIAVHAPPETENNFDFVRKGLVLGQAGVHTPKIYAVDYRAGFLLLEDLGEKSFLSELKKNPHAQVYSAGLETLMQIQSISLPCSESENDQVFSRYTSEILYREMQLFPQWFVARLLGLSLQADEEALLQDTFSRLSASALEQPQVVVHRDFQIRNLHLLGDGGVGVIDYQDALIGPATYDLVSLLKDCYIYLSEPQIQQYLEEYLVRALAPATGLAGDVLEGLCDARLFRRWFDLMGLQRHIKVLGIFARLQLRDNKPNYLAELPLFIRYVLEASSCYPELGDFRQWFVDRILPVLPEQSWYTPWESAGERT